MTNPLDKLKLQNLIFLTHLGEGLVKDWNKGKRIKVMDAIQAINSLEAVWVTALFMQQLDTQSVELFLRFLRAELTR